jgi:hypothetical protein
MAQWCTTTVVYHNSGVPQQWCTTTNSLWCTTTYSGVPQLTVCGVPQQWCTTTVVYHNSGVPQQWCTTTVVYHNSALNVSKAQLGSGEQQQVLPALDPYNNPLYMPLEQFVEHPIAKEVLHKGAFILPGGLQAGAAAARGHACWAAGATAARGHARWAAGAAAARG